MVNLSTRNYSFHHLPWDRGEAEQPVFPQILIVHSDSSSIFFPGHLPLLPPFVRFLFIFEFSSFTWASCHSCLTSCCQDGLKLLGREPWKSNSSPGLLFSAISRGILPSWTLRPLNRSKSALTKSRVVILWFCPNSTVSWSLQPSSSPFVSIRSRRTSPLVSSSITFAKKLSVLSENILCHCKCSKIWPLETLGHTAVHPNTSRQALRWEIALRMSSSYHQLCYYYYYFLDSETQEAYRWSRANQIISTRKIHLLLGVKDRTLFPLEVRRGVMKAAGSLVVVVSRNSSQHGTAVYYTMRRMVLVETICPLLF